MPLVTVCVREVGKLKVEFSLVFDLPSIPSIGDYISVTRADIRDPFGEDYIVRNVWWRLRHSGLAESVGTSIEVFVECDQSCGPYATDAWERMFDSANASGKNLEPFKVARVRPATYRDNDL